jgi:hypothetical protein
MYSEILAAGCKSKYDPFTHSDIAFCATMGKDDYTPAGTWINYNGERSTKELVAFAKAMGMRGAFLFELSMDTMSADESTFTYELSLAVDAALRA